MIFNQKSNIEFNFLWSGGVCHKIHCRQYEIYKKHLQLFKDGVDDTRYMNGY